METEIKPKTTPIKQQALTIINMVYKRDKKTKEIQQIRFTIDDGTTITYKPNVDIVETIKNNGVSFEDSETVKPTMDKLELAYPVLKQIKDALTQKKEVTVLADYYKLETTNNDGEEQTYYFFRDWNIKKMVVV